MILKFFQKCFIQCVFIVLLSSCTPGSNTAGKVDSSKGKAPAAKEALPANPPPEEGSTEGDSAVSDQEGSLPPPVVTSEAPAGGSSKNDPAVSDREGESLSPSEEPAAVSSGAEPASQSLPPLNKKILSPEDIINAGLLKEGDSDLVTIYFAFWLNYIGHMLHENGFPDKKEWLEWCYTSDCLNGLDLKKIKTPQMREIIEWISSNQTITFDLNPGSEQADFNVFFQSYLAPPGWGLLHYKEGEIAPHMADMQQTIDQMKEKGAKRVAVNLPFQRHVDPLPFFMLGKFMKENQMDLHIVGGCEAYCAKYLIPAAKTVHIGPYGYIYFNGSFKGIYEQFQSVIPAQKAAHKNHWREELSEVKKADKVKTVAIFFEQIIEQIDSVNVFIDDFKGFELESAQKFQAQLQAFYPRVNKTDIKAFTEEERRLFLEQLPPETLDSLISLTVSMLDPKTEQRTKNAGILSLLSIAEAGYYGNIKANYVLVDEEAQSATANNYVVFDKNSQGLRPRYMLVDKNNHYTYAGLLDLAAKFLYDFTYAQIFSVPKPYYNIPEEEKSYHIIAPSTELLRRVGFDVRGENNIDMLGIDKNSKQEVLYLDSKRIENCGFFKEGVSYKTLDCLFE